MLPWVSLSLAGSTALVVTSPGMSPATAGPESAITPDTARIVVVLLDTDGSPLGYGPRRAACLCGALTFPSSGPGRGLSVAILTPATLDRSNRAGGRGV